MGCWDISPDRAGAKRGACGLWLIILIQIGKVFTAHSHNQRSDSDRRNTIILVNSHLNIPPKLQTSSKLESNPVTYYFIHFLFLVARVGLSQH